MIPTIETVAVGWLANHVLAADVPVVHVVPARSRDHFADLGAVVVTAVDGASDAYLRQGVAQIDCYAFDDQAGADLPDFQKASQLAATIEAAASTLRQCHTISRSGYDDAHIRTVAVIGGPRQLPDVGQFARFSVDVRIHWT